MAIRNCDVFVTLKIRSKQERYAIFASKFINCCDYEKKLLWTLFAIITSVAFAEEIDISLVTTPPANPGDGNGGKSLAFYPKASISSSASTLSIAYPLDAVSVVQIVDEATDAVVYSDSFGATRIVVIDLEEEGLTTGNYRLRIFVFGEWWSGEFEIE